MDICKNGVTEVTPFRLSKNLYNEKGRPPYPYKSAKSRDLCVAFCTSQGRGAPLVRWPDGHTFFAFLHRTCPARERSMGAEALRQPLAKTRKSGLSHFFDTLNHRQTLIAIVGDFFIFNTLLYRYTQALHFRLKLCARAYNSR